MKPHVRLLLVLLTLVSVVQRLGATTWSDNTIASGDTPNLASALGPNGYRQIAWTDHNYAGQKLNYTYEDGTGYHNVSFTAATVGVAYFNGSYQGSAVGLAIDSNNRPHIVLVVEKTTGVTGERGVWYATYNGSGTISSASNWTFSRVATYTSSNGWLNVYGAGIAIDPTVNRPAIAWFVADSNSPRSTTLYYTTLKSDGTWPAAGAATNDAHTGTPATPTGATIIDQITGGEQDHWLTMWPFGFAIDSNGKHAFVAGYDTQNQSTYDTMKYGTDASGSWVRTIVQQNLGYTILQGGTLAFDASNHPRIAWRNTNDNTINLETYNGTNWSHTQVATANPDYNGQVSYAQAGSIELVAYTDMTATLYDAVNGLYNYTTYLKTATRFNGTGGWTLQTLFSANSSMDIDYNTTPAGIGDDVSATLTSSGGAVIAYGYGEFTSGGSARYATGTISPPNTAPTFVGSTTTLTVAENSSGTDLKSLLHVSDTDSSQTETWSQSSAPSHGTLSFSSATAASGSSDITPGGTITYTPTNGYAGSDSFTVQVSDGTATATRTISVTVQLVPTVSSVSVPANGTYVVGANLDFTVNFSTAVTVTGSPQLPLTVGSTSRNATYLSGSGSTALVFSHTVPSGDSDTDGITVGSNLSLNGGTITAQSGGAAATLTLNSVGSTAGVLVDGIVPTLSSVSIMSSNTNHALAKTSDSITLTFTASEAIGVPTVLLAGHSVSATNGSGNSWSASYTMTGTDAEGAIPFSVAFSDLAGNAGTTVTATTDSSSVTFDRTFPLVTAAHISISGGTGTGGAYKTGDVLNITWDNTAAGDNNSDIASARASVIPFGGTIVTLTNNAGLWRGTYTIVAGSKDATNVNVSISATDNAGNANSPFIADDTNATVDNQAPTVTDAKISLSGATGTGGAFKIGDTVTATWNNTAGGDNNADIAGVTVNFSQFGGGSAVTATNSSGTWTATYMIVAGAISTTNRNVSVTATDDAGNTTTTADTTSATVDNIAPTESSVGVPANATYIVGQSLGFTVNFSENVTVTGTPRIALTLGSTTVYATYASGSGTTTLSFSYTVQNGDRDTDGITVGALTLNGGTINDSAGNAAVLTLNSVGSTASVLVDGVPPTVGGSTVPANGTYGVGQNLDFTVTFSENVVVTGGPYVTVTLDTGGVVHAAYLSGSGTTTLTFRYTTVSGDADPTGIVVGSSVTLNGGTINDAAGNAATTSVTFGATTGVLIDAVVPAVSSINRQTPSGAATNVTSVTFRATFSRTVTGVDSSDFALVATGTAAGTIASVSPVSGAIYDVTVSSVSGDGTLRLDLKSSGTGIADLSSNALSGGFTAGQTYTIDHAAPVVSTIARQSPATVNTAAASATYRVTFSEDVTGVDAADFTLTVVSGAASGTIGTVTPVSASVYDVAVSLGTGQGQLRLDLNASGTGVADLAGNAITSGFTAGDFYYTGVTNVFDAVSLINGGTLNVSHATSTMVAQRFTTAATAPLSLTTVTAWLGSITGTPAPVVKIVADNGGVPGATVITTLTNPASLTANVLNVWTSTQLLAANTTYWVVFSDTSGAGAYTLRLSIATSGGVGAWLNSPTDYAVYYGANLAVGPQSGVVQLALGATSVPTITSTLTASATYGSVFGGYTITATNTPSSYAATGLPTGLSVNASTGVISGTPAQSGSFNVSLTATNGSGTGTPSTLVLTVAKANLTVTGVVANNKTYDRALTGTLNTTSAVLHGVAFSDVLAIDTSGATIAFASTGVANGIVVNASGVTVTGTAAGNYTLTQPTGLTANITAKTLTVTGITAANKTYDGTNTATLTTSGAALVGVISPDNVTLTTGAAAGTFADANAAAAKTVTITGLALAGTDAGNYVLTAPTATADITAAAVTITLSNLSQTYDGTPKSATASSTVPVTVAYNGSATAPTNAGSYAVTAAAADTNHVGSATGTLTIARANQTISFTLPSSTTPGVSITLAATSNAGLPVTFSVVSGNGTITGTTLVVNSGSVTVRATQAGDFNHNAATADQTISAAGKLSQTITFNPLSNHTASEPPFTLSATASSNLPVSFSVVSGPAVLNGNTLTLTGVAGSVTIRASQAGNATYNAAADVTQSFNVLAAGHQVFFGLTQNNDTIAIDLAPDGKSGTLLCYIGATGQAFIVDFTVQADGTFDAQVTPLSVGSGLVQTASDRPVAAATTTTLHGLVSGNTISGSFTSLGLSFSTTLQPSAGSTAAISGLYRSSTIDSASGTTASIVGTQGQVLVVASTATITTGGTGTVAGNGTFTVAATGATIAGTVDAPTTTVSGTITVPGQQSVPFAGLASSTLRTDRLINLSSRARVGPSGDRTLITGFVIGGTAPKRVLLRAVGPALGGFGITDALVNPRLVLYDSAGNVLLQNDDWSGSETAAAYAQVGAFGLTAGSQDAALLTTLQPGGYTMQVVDGGGTGVALAEIYDASPNPQGDYQRLINISSRGTVDAGNGVLIGGFVITGNSPKKVLVRGVGPGLVAFGLPTALTDPRLVVFSGQTAVAQNNDWGVPQPLSSAQTAATAADLTAAAQATGAFALVTNSKDAVLIVTLAPGAYTAQVSAADGTSTGVALVEIYEVP